jgi:cardiolipin synthase
VRTVLILPPDDKNDVPVVRDAFSWVQNDVVRSGIELYKYRGRMVHTKVASFDGRVGTCGSSNLDDMALSHLAECNVFVPDRGFAATIERRIFARDLPASDRLQEKKLSWWEKVKGGALHFFRSML